MDLFRKAADSGYTAAANGLAVSLTDGSQDNNFTEAFLYFDRSVDHPMVHGSGFGVQGLGFRSVEHPMVQGSGFGSFKHSMVQGLGFRVLNYGLSIIPLFKRYFPYSCFFRIVKISQLRGPRSSDITRHMLQSIDCPLNQVVAHLCAERKLNHECLNRADPKP